MNAPVIAERIASKPFASMRLSELHSATVEDGELLASLARSLVEAAWRGQTYLARAHAVEARKVLLEIMKATSAAQEIEGALKLEAARQDEKGGPDEQGR